jgi:ABC-2 type transport system permease protein
MRSFIDRKGFFSMNKIVVLVRTNFVMLMRQRALIISSLGVAIISIVIFGALFGGNNSTKTVLGLVDQDHSSISARFIADLKKSDALSIYTGTDDVEQQELKDGHRNAVVIIPAGFGKQIVEGGAHLQVFYDQSNPISTAATQLTVQAIVDNMNRAVTHQPGPVTLEQQAVTTKDVRTIDFMTPGMLGMLLMWANLAVGVQMVNWRQLGVTRRLAATPLTPLTMIAGQVVARLLLSLLQGVVLLVLASLLFHVGINGNLGLLFLMVTLGSLTMLALGFAIASFVKKPEAAQSIQLLISFPMMFLGGSYFPVNGAPDFIQPLIHAMPLYYLNDALRQIMLNGADWSAIQTSVLILLAWIVAAMLVVWRSFKWL